MRIMMNTFQQKQGFTLIEVLLSLVVAAVLLAMAAPSFTTLTKNKRINAQANEFVATLALARSEALKRVPESDAPQSRVAVCASANGTTCASSGSWEQGWIVFHNKDDDQQVDASASIFSNEPIIKVYSALSGNNTLKGSSSVARYIAYSSSGTTMLPNGTFQSGSVVLCDDRGASEHARSISVNITGRVRVEDTAPENCAP